MEEWSLSPADITWSWFGWFFLVYGIFQIPSSVVRHATVMWVYERSAKVGNIALVDIVHRLTGISVQFIFVIVWMVMYAFVASCAFVVWNEQMWEDAGAELGLMVSSWVLAALWFPIYFCKWPYSARYSFIPLSLSIGCAIAAIILTWIEVTSFAWLFIPYTAWLIIAFYTIIRQPYSGFPCCTVRHTDKFQWPDAPLDEMTNVPVPPSVFIWSSMAVRVPAYARTETTTREKNAEEGGVALMGDDDPLGESR